MLNDQRKLQNQSRTCAAIVADVLWAVLVLRQPADRVLAGIFRQNHKFGARDRRLISELVFAVLRWWGWLQLAAPPLWLTAVQPARAGAATPSPPPLPPTAWAPLLWAAAFLEANPLVFRQMQDFWQEQAALNKAAATVDAVADLAGKAAQLRAMVPGIFAAAALEPAQLLPPWAWTQLATAAVNTPCELLQWLQQRPPMWLRTQGEGRSKALPALHAAGLTVVPHPRLPTALQLDAPRVNLYTLPEFRQGWFEVQDLASQTVAQVCAPQPRQRWWDCCAGGGGKSLHLAELMQGTGTVVASDVRAHKLEDLRRRARRGGFSNIQCRDWDGRPPAKKRCNFDGVLVDAPCTCSGTWRRNPDGRWRIDSAEVAQMATLQTQILTNAATAVKPGGVLVYATCSMFGAENQAVVETFLAAHPQFRRQSFTDVVTGASTDGMLQIWPWHGNCDSMFVARLARQS